MVRTCVKTKKGPSVGLYMVMVRDYMSSFLSPKMEGDVKDAIKKIGGSINQSGLFLSTTSKETVINRSTGINRRSVAFIPRIKISDDILQMLDQSEFHIVYNKVMTIFVVCNKSQVHDNTVRL